MLLDARLVDPVQLIRRVAKRIISDLALRWMTGWTAGGALHPRSDSTAALLQGKLLAGL